MKKTVRCKRLTLLLFSIVLLSASVLASSTRACSGSEDQVTRRLQNVMKLAARRHKDLFGVLDQPMSGAERKALTFLLAYAPLSDLADLDGAYFLETVQSALRAKREMPWGSSIPEEIFLRYVLPTRVNNENLDRFRPLMYREISERVKNLSLQQAALEINHWCHEYVSYKSTDDRTSSPLDTMKTTFGRCGEESTFTVAALRTVCIPARQCYTPRWAHTDDNHAWVEVWIQGKWHYMGACEPETDLDRAWFDGPVKRAMLVHSMAYGKVREDEEILSQKPGASMLNLIGHYAQNTRLEVRILDRQHQPVNDADVRFQLYNYAEFYTLSHQKSDRDGRVSFRTGHGDLFVMASQGKRFGFARIRVASHPQTEIVLDHELGDSISLDLDFSPPADVEIPLSTVPDDLVHFQRLAKGDAIRKALEKRFIDRESTRQLARSLSVDASELWPLMKSSRGNWQEIETFLKKTPQSKRSLAITLLKTISEKDLRDTSAPVLLSHLNEMESPISLDQAYTLYVLNPRIATEKLLPYRRIIRQAISFSLIDSFQKDPRRISQWIDRNITLASDDLNHYRVPLTPAGTLSLGLADRQSRDIFAVALCRSLGIPARLGIGIRAPQVLHQGRWLPLWPQDRNKETAALMLTKPRAEGYTTATYYANFTLSHFRNGQFETLEYPFNSSFALFEKSLALPAGHYRLLTGIRMYNDDILTRLQYFTLLPGQGKKVPIVLREGPKDFRSDLSLPSNLHFELIDESRKAPLSGLIPREGALLCFIRSDHEPSRHLLDDISRIKKQLDNWGGTVFLIIRERREADSLDAETRERLPQNTVLVRIPADENAFSPRFAYPCCILIDRDLSIGFSQKGYRVGSDAFLLRALDSISDKTNQVKDPKDEE